MFTGIVTDIGTVRSLTLRGPGARVRIETDYDPDTIALGASIACSGPCLTVVERGRLEDGSGYFDVEASSETLARTTLGSWRIGTRVNLERSLRAGDEMGGHFVSGHVDGLATIEARDEEAGMARFRLRLPGSLARFVAE